MGKTATDRSAVSPPGGNGKATGMGEAFTLDLNSGQGTYSIPFDLPDGVAGFKPSFSLEYAHSNANGPFGWGWAYRPRQISRRLDFGIAEDQVVETYLDSGVEIRKGTDGLYYALRESTFSRREKLNDGWLVMDRDGTQYFFGLTQNFRISFPGHPDQIQTWLLERQEDVNGNKIQYTYDFNGDDRYPYLIEIRYAIFSVQFLWEDRDDVFRNGRMGFVSSISKRCKEISLHIVSDDFKFRSLEFKYQYAALSGHSVLTSYQLIAKDRNKPDVVKNHSTFEYSQFEADTFSVDWISSIPGEPVPPPLTDPNTVLIALDDLPLPGVLQHLNGRQYYWPNNGKGGWGAVRILPGAPFASGIRSDRIQFLDMSANGTPDMIVGLGEKQLQGFYENGGRKGFENFIAYPEQSNESPPFLSGNVRITELNGDGFVDALYATQHGMVTFQSEGKKGWRSAGVSAEAPKDIHFGDRHTFLADMTGDGQPDLVRVRSGQIEYWMNLGRGRFGEKMIMEKSPRIDRLHDDTHQVLLMDANGDGLADLVIVGPEGLTLYINKYGKEFSDPKNYPILPVVIPGTLQPADMHGTGSCGLVYNSMRNGKTGYVSFAWKSKYAPHFLTKISNGNGLNSEIEYAPMVSMALLDLADGVRWETFMPFPIWVVSATKEEDIFRKRITTANYRYHDGHFDPLLRRFSGFHKVSKIETGDDSRADVMTHYKFLMNQAARSGATPSHVHLDRLMSKVEIYSLDGSISESLPFHTEETQYALIQLPDLADGSKRVYPVVIFTMKKYTERTSDERVEETTYTYDGEGNVIAENASGFGMQNNVPVPKKFIRTEVSYSTNAERTIFKIARVVKRDEAGNILNEIHKYYDGQPLHPLPLGVLTKGLKTHDRALAMTQADFQIHYAGMNIDDLGYIALNDSDGNPAVFAPGDFHVFHAKGNTLEVHTPAGLTTKYDYDTNDLFKTKETVNGKQALIVPHPIHGKPLQVIASTGEVTAYDYDAFGRLTMLQMADDTIADPTRMISYDDVNLPNSRKFSYRIKVGERAESITYYDGAGNELQKRVRRKPGEWLVSGYETTNPWGQLKSEFEQTVSDSHLFSVPVGIADDVPRRLVFYDGEGRPVRNVNFNGGINRVDITPFEYHVFDANDNDPNHLHVNTPRIEQTDVWNFRTGIIEKRDTTSTLRTTYELDLLGNITAHYTNGVRNAGYHYDKRGNRIIIEHADAGVRKNWFNATGELVRTLDASGNDVMVRRDAESRIKVVSVNGIVVEQYDYNDVTPGSSGRLTDARYANDGRMQYFFDARGRMERHIHTVNQVAYEFKHEFNDMGKETALLYPDGSRIERSYYENGFVRNITGYIDNIQYNSRGLPERITFANGTETTYSYWPGNGRIRNMKTTGHQSQVLEDVQCQYDLMQMLTQLNDAAPGAVQQMQYNYDGLFQLKEATGSDTQGAWAQSYTYDSAYNLLRSTESGWEMKFDDAVKKDRVTSIQRSNHPDFVIPYDANGNISTLPDKSFQYNFKNQLEKVTLANGKTVRYEYDFRGNMTRRVEEHQGSKEETVYLGKSVEINNGQVRKFILLNRVRVAIILANGMKRWIHSDQLGTARFFTDEAATKIAEIAYYPFGIERFKNGNPLTRTFVMHEYDAVTGMVHMKHRWYCPEMARFITPDPMFLYQPEKSEGSPVQLHLYTYVGNSPVNRVDPSGTSFWSVVGAIVGVAVGILAGVLLVAAFATGIGAVLLVIAGIAALMTVSYIVAHNNMGNGWGEFFRGFMIGLNAGLNASILAAFGPVGLALGIGVGVVNFLAAIDSVAGNQIYQGILGWSNWLMPMSWLIIAVGLVVFILNLLGHFFLWSIPSLWGGGVNFFRIEGLRMDWSTGAIAMKGGWLSNVNAIDTAYNLGNFTYVDINDTSPDWHLNHESGHNLNLAAFGSIFHLIGFVHEMGLGAGSGAFSEVLADSNDPTAGPVAVPMWS